MSDKNYQSIRIYCDACRQIMDVDDDFIHRLTGEEHERAIYVKPCECTDLRL